MKVRLLELLTTIKDNEKRLESQVAISSSLRYKKEAETNLITELERLTELANRNNQVAISQLEVASPMIAERLLIQMKHKARIS
ncbi:hypothetical protein LCGC14_2970030 [marine sediment metagenome]|uniref:Uncharacterized protein n=1 Tax=marine sediment metagenome TaxID=412755 RepID=A0A0F8XAK9_9ZZZZ